MIQDNHEQTYTFNLMGREAVQRLTGNVLRQAFSSTTERSTKLLARQLAVTCLLLEQGVPDDGVASGFQTSITIPPGEANSGWNTTYTMTVADGFAAQSLATLLSHGPIKAPSDRGVAV